MTDEEFVEECFRKLLLRAPEAEGKAYYVARLREGASRVDVVQGIVVSEEFLELLHRQAFGSHVGSRALAFAPPGHFYSPIPSRADITRYAAAAFATGPEALAGIDLDVAGQLALLRELGPHAADLDFADQAGGTTRYFWENGGFAPGDAVVLAAMLRYLRPARVVEIGAYLIRFQRDAVARHMPLALRRPRAEPEGNTAVSLWITRS